MRSGDKTCCQSRHLRKWSNVRGDSEAFNCWGSGGQSLNGTHLFNATFSSSLQDVLILKFPSQTPICSALIQTWHLISIIVVNIQVRRVTGRSPGQGGPGQDPYPPPYWSRLSPRKHFPINPVNEWIAGSFSFCESGAIGLDCVAWERKRRILRVLRRIWTRIICPADSRREGTA